MTKAQEKTHLRLRDIISLLEDLDRLLLDEDTETIAMDVLCEETSELAWIERSLTSSLAVIDADLRERRAWEREQDELDRLLDLEDQREWRRG